MPVSAEIVGAELGRIEEEFGEVTPVAIVDAARPDDNPLHRLFTWDDSVAGPKYRLTQAQTILRNLVVMTKADESDDEEPKHRTVRAFLNVPSDDDVDDDEPLRMVYMNAQTALGNPQKRAYVLDQARQDLERWRNRYFGLTEFAELITAIDDTLRNFTNEVKIAA